MGMYNEVFKKCPHCGKKGYMQISQVVLGFGGFDLDDPTTLSELNLEELKMLQERVYDDYFSCKSESCGNSFRIFADADEDARQQIIKDLTA